MFDGGQFLCDISNEMNRVHCDRSCAPSVKTNATTVMLTIR
jgi:hypothetical protein